ncbi:TauD/TfdA family dioxygenase [Amycolatopsis nigrescens]|uniref:TauD/TfdA family dioxygenase n=1 Tax=Amycolatopsis nigrescens TaxID=381445 RepID=UPI0004760898|nr:TauD/TfdA family dioxygenase [Amycolatopsis nigrescens]
MEILLQRGRPARVEAPGIRDLAEARTWLCAARTEIRAALDEHGALVLRGLPVRSVREFVAVRDVILPPPGEVRRGPSFGDDICFREERDPARPIRMHNENSYALTFPGTLLFGCLVAPEHGGATQVADCRAVLRNLPEGLAEKFRTFGWRLTSSHERRRSEFSECRIRSRADVERYCAENLISCAWESGRLRTGRLRSAIIRHPHTGEELWFNHVTAANARSLEARLRAGPGGGEPLCDTAFGNGDVITDEDVAALNKAYDAATFRERWRQGDLLLVDNLLTAHGREPSRTAGRIMVAGGAQVGLDECDPTVAPAAV